MNAGLLAVSILGAGAPHLFSAVECYRRALEAEVMEKVDKLEQVGWEKYEIKR